MLRPADVGAPTLSRVAELELIAAIERSLAVRGGRVAIGVGDDAAVVRASGVAVTSVDLVAEGIHFRWATHSPEDVGHKALGSALSDLAAMGAHAGEAYVGMALPRGFDPVRTEGIVAGMEALAERTGTTIAGGDVVEAGALTLSVTVTGWADDLASLACRHGARADHLVGVTGRLGASGAGLLLLDGTRADLAKGVAEALIERHRRPAPRLATGRRLVQAGVSAMIDVSDGVATDAAHLAARSGARLELDLTALPLAQGVEEVADAAGRDAYELAAAAGEDYELLFTAPPENRERVRESLGEGDLTWLGRVSSGSGVVLRGRDGAGVRLAGYEHG